MDVVVHMPRVRGSRVRFSWTQDVESTVQRASHWSVRYPGVPLAAVLKRATRALLYDVLLSVQLPLWLHDADGPVQIALPEYVPQARIQFWLAYHDADDVTIKVPDPGPQDLEDPPLLSAPEETEQRVAVTFGGGKDSTLALEVLRERRRPDQVLLLHAVHPRVPGRRALARALWRSLRHIVRPPLRRHGVPLQLAITDHMSHRTATAPGPHINLYAPLNLPALIHRRVHNLVFSNSVMGYRVSRGASGKPRFTNPTGRPERLDHLRRYTAEHVGWELAVECTHRAVVDYLSFGVLRERYPEAFASIVMCPRYRAHGRFCGDCSKCLEHAVFGLSLGYAADDLNYSRLFTSDRVKRIVARAEAVSDVIAAHGNGPYDRAIGTKTHFAGWCHALSKIDVDQLPVQLSAAARSNLAQLVAVWGRHPFGASQRVDPDAMAACGPLGREVAEVVAASDLVATAPDTQDPLLVGDEPGQFDHGAQMPTPRLDAWAARWRTRAVSAPAAPSPS